jgi:HSP20 family protein
MSMMDLIPLRRREHSSQLLRPESKDWFARELGRLENMFNSRVPNFLGQRESSGMLQPSVEVKEKEDRFIVTAELPGMEEKDIDVHIDDDTLVIQGEKNEEKSEENDESSWTERRYGKFVRRIPLDAGLKAEEASAKFKKGVLTLVLPKTDAAKKRRKKITVKSE